MREKMSGVGGGDYNSSSDNEHKILLMSNSSSSEPDLEAHGSKTKGLTDLLKQLDKRFSGRRLSGKHLDRVPSSSLPSSSTHDPLADGAPPEWALLLIGCLLGLATGLCVATFNHGVGLFT